MPRETTNNLDFQRSKRKYLSTIRYLKQIQKSGKIYRLTRSQILALRSRLTRCLGEIRKYLKLGIALTSLCTIATTEINAQCRMNRLPLSTQSSFFVMNGSNHAVGDIDMDGDFDMAIGGYFGPGQLYENNKGTFIPVDGALNPVPLGGLSNPSFVDIDSDGDIDLFLGGNDTPKFYQNQDGQLTNVTGNANPLNNIPASSKGDLAFVDIDNDGDQDLFIDGFNEVKFFRNENGVFNEDNTGNPLNGIGSSQHTFVDIDNDGDPDYFSNKSELKFYRNDNGIFNEVTGSQNPLNILSSGVPEFVDIDLDGDNDAFILTGSASGSIIKFYRNINGVFHEILDNSIPFHGIDVGNNSSPFFADIDEDGDEDAFVGTDAGTISALLNTNGEYQELLGNNNPFNGINVGNDAKPVLVDIDPTDADTDLDLFIGAGDGTIHYFRNDNGTFIAVTGAGNPLNGFDVGTSAAPTFVDFDGDNDKDAFVGAGDGTIHYFRNDNGNFTEVIGADNPFDGIDVGGRATPSFFRFNSTLAYVGVTDGTIREYKKSGSKYVHVVDSPFNGIDVGSRSIPTIQPDLGVVIGNGNGGVFVFKDSGGRSNVWQGPFSSNWHGPASNWELMTIPKSGCDNVHVLDGSVLDIDPFFSAEGRTLTIRDGGQFEVKSGSELLIDPD